MIVRNRTSSRVGPSVASRESGVHSTFRGFCPDSKFPTPASSFVGRFDKLSLTAHSSCNSVQQVKTPGVLNRLCETLRILRALCGSLHLTAKKSAEESIVVESSFPKTLEFVANTSERKARGSILEQSDFNHEKSLNLNS